MKKQEPKEIFVQRLAQDRKMRGISLRALADATGGKISYNALHRYELGDTMPGEEVLMAVADALEQSLDFFFRPVTTKLQEVNFRKTTKVGAKTVEANSIKFLEVQAPEHFDGFSGWADGHPVVVLANWLNKNLPRKRFTALHRSRAPSYSLARRFARKRDRAVLQSFFRGYTDSSKNVQDRMRRLPYPSQFSGTR